MKLLHILKASTDLHSYLSGLQKQSKMESEQLPPEDDRLQFKYFFKFTKQKLIFFLSMILTSLLTVIGVIIVMKLNSNETATSLNFNPQISSTTPQENNTTDSYDPLLETTQSKETRADQNYIS